MPLHGKHHWPSLTHQHISLEFSFLKSKSPDGIYLSPIPGNPTGWSGVLFVRKGPYAQAILHFLISFPADYPRSPPLITFQSEIFHPLVTPQTTHAHPTGSRKSDSISRNDDKQLPPGGLSLRHGFPSWCKGSENSTTFPGPHSKNDQQHGTGSLISGSSLVDGEIPVSSVSSDIGVERVAKPFQQRSPNGRSFNSGILGVLQYVAAILEDGDILDRLDLHDAANPGAWHAWRAHRGMTNEVDLPPDDRSDRISTGEAGAAWVGDSFATSQRPPATWNWDGVWVDRVRKAVNISRSDSVLYKSGNGNEVIQFLDLDEDTIEVIRKNILKGKHN